jgi:hypothetical protein
MTHVFLVIATIAIAWFLPSEEKMERYSVSQQRAMAP